MLNWRPVVDFELRELEFNRREIEFEKRRIAHEQRIRQLAPTPEHTITPRADRLLARIRRIQLSTTGAWLFPEVAARKRADCGV